jgi:uncharacterized protein YndB with AHSA1/START domain
MGNVLEVTRIFPASAEQVWKAWTEPSLVMQWWGPDHFTCPRAEIDFREGGKSIVSMKSPPEMGGMEWISIWEYRKIVPMQRIEFVQNFGDAAGNKVSPAKLGMPADFPEDMLTIVTFKDLGGGKTEMTVAQHADFGQMSHFAKMGLEQSLGKMERIFG